MQVISKINLTDKILNFIQEKDIAKSEAVPIETFRELLYETAHLSILNKDHIIYFRGQDSDYKNKKKKSTFYPTIYRGNRVTKSEIYNRFEILSLATQELNERFQQNDISNFKDIKYKKLIQWSILQHYNVCDTPLFDVTQSLRVACSFAFLEKEEGDEGFVYLFGLPYLTNRISHNSEHDIVNIRLLSICPPEALRPFYQEGFLVGTEDITTDYDSKDDLDFNNRLIAKFKIKNDSKFWEGNMTALTKEFLLPQGDQIRILCESILKSVNVKMSSNQLGEFINIWKEIEIIIIKMSQRIDSSIYTILPALKTLESSDILDKELIYKLHQLRTFRNTIVHRPIDVSFPQMNDHIELAKAIYQVLQIKLKK